MLHVEQLHAGEIDVGFVRPPLDDPRLEELRLGREPMVCVLPRGHRLTRRTAVRPRDLDGEPLVWWPEAHGPGAWREIRREVCAIVWRRSDDLPTLLRLRELAGDVAGRAR